jgi:hypothetical protein
MAASPPSSTGLMLLALLLLLLLSLLSLLSSLSSLLSLSSLSSLLSLLLLVSMLSLSSLLSSSPSPAGSNWLDRHMYANTLFHVLAYFSIVLPIWPAWNGFSFDWPPASRRSM